MNSVLHTEEPVPIVLGMCTRHSYSWYNAHMGYVQSLFFNQINSWKELDDKMVAIVHLDQKEIEEHQDLLG